MIASSEVNQTPTTNSSSTWSSLLCNRPWTREEKADAAAMEAVSIRILDRPDHVFSGLYRLFKGQQGDAAANKHQPLRNSPEHELVVAVPLEDVITSLVETESMRQLALRQLQEAVIMLPVGDSADLLMALTNSPKLVQTESDPMRYLRCENYNPWAAAASLAAYWRFRRNLFGDKAFRPLSLTGEGALDEECLSSIKNGSDRILTTDTIGRTVVLGDTSRRLHHTASTRLKCSFFFMTVVSENPVSQTDGVVCLLTDSGTPKLDNFLSTEWQMATHFPIRTPLILFCYCVPRSSLYYFAAVITSYISLGLINFFLRNKIIQHITDSKDEMVQRLESMGFTKESIPISLGGICGLEDHAQWYLERKSLNQLVHNSHPSSQSSSLSTTAEIKNLLYENCTQLIPLAMDELPSQSKVAYQQAMEQNNELVKVESNMNDLLLKEDYHVSTACRRLMEYWEIRTQLFGSRALLVMNQTGDGILDRSDWMAIRSGFIMLVPNDIYGRSVVIFDLSLIEHDTKHNENLSIYRCIFYILSVASENETAITKGIVLIVHLSSRTADQTIQQQFNMDQLRTIVMVLPLQVAAIHLCTANTNSSSNGNNNSDIPKNELSRWVDGLNFGWKPKVHIVNKTTTASNNTTNSWVSILQTYGIPSGSIPTRMGGTWQFSNFIQWEELRIRCEWDLPISRNALVRKSEQQPKQQQLQQQQEEQNINTTVNNNHHDTAIDYPGLQPPRYRCIPSSSIHERHKRLEIILGRRSRDKVRIQMYLLQEEINQLKNDQNQYIQEQRQLQHSLQQVQRITELIERQYSYEEEE